jgi:hypothetical protein
MEVHFEKIYTDTGRPPPANPSAFPGGGSSHRWIKAIKLTDLGGLIEPLQEWLETAGFLVVKQSKTGVLFVYPAEVE